MNKKIKLLILLLSVALCAVSISFYCNHKRWVARKKLVARTEVARTENNRIVSIGKYNLRQVAIVNCPKTLSNRPVFVTYAQVFEDIILHDVLSDVKIGFYVDVGANHPIECSVTKFFYEKGWRGINLEPLLEEYANLVADRPRDINLCLCAGSKNEELELYENGGLSTLDVNIAKTWRRELNPRKVKIVPLSEICEKYCSENQAIEFCKIDVEGFEREVLLGFDFQKFRPKIFVVEATEPCTMIPTQQKWEEILFENGYEFAYQFGVNRYYTDRGLPKLKEKFIDLDLDKLLEKYIVIKN